MTNFNKILIVSILTVCGDLCAEQQESKEISAGEYLVKIGDLYDLHFTIEQIEKKVEKENRTFYRAEDFLSIKIVPFAQDVALDKHLEVIGTAINLIIKSSEDNRRIYHIRDTRISIAPDYPLDKIVPKFNFKGTPVEMIQSLKKLDNKLVPFVNHGFPVLKDNDSISQITIVSTGVSVRNILTNSLPLSYFDRILWTSSVNPQTSVCTVCFNRSFLGDNAGSKSIDWRQGRHAYEFILRQQRHWSVDAIKYLENVNHNDSKDQSRWAMRLLGDLACLESIELLVRNLTFQYAPVEDLCEAYPAAYALIKIGEPALKIILTQAEINKKNKEFYKIAAFIFVKICGKEKSIVFINDFYKQRSDDFHVNRSTFIDAIDDIKEEAQKP